MATKYVTRHGKAFKVTFDEFGNMKDVFQLSTDNAPVKLDAANVDVKFFNYNQQAIRMFSAFASFFMKRDLNVVFSNSLEGYVL